MEKENIENKEKALSRCIDRILRVEHLEEVLSYRFENKVTEKRIKEVELKLNKILDDMLVRFFIIRRNYAIVEPRSIKNRDSLIKYMKNKVSLINYTSIKQVDEFENAEVLSLYRSLVKVYDKLELDKKRPEEEKKRLKLCKKKEEKWSKRICKEICNGQSLTVENFKSWMIMHPLDAIAQLVEFWKLVSTYYYNRDPNKKLLTDGWYPSNMFGFIKFYASGTYKNWLDSKFNGRFPNPIPPFICAIEFCHERCKENNNLECSIEDATIRRLYKAVHKNLYPLLPEIKKCGNKLDQLITLLSGDKQVFASKSYKLKKYKK